jgi:uncharacterized membrane protein YfhO
VVRPTFLRDDPTYKKLEVQSDTGDGVLFINIPYARVWEASVNGKPTPVWSANGAFLGVKVHEKNAVVEIFVDSRPSLWWLLFSGSIVLTVLLMVLYPRRVASCGARGMKWILSKRPHTA